MSEFPVNLPAAAAFYLIYPVGVLVFVVGLLLFLATAALGWMRRRT